MTNLLRLSPPTFEHHPTGLGLAEAAPRVSWRFLCTDGGPKGWEQEIYEIEIAQSPEIAGETYRVSSNESVLVPWPSAPLRSREQRSVRVRVYGSLEGQSSNVSSAWSPWATVECALLERSDWQACVIGNATKPSTESPFQPIRFRRTFALPFDPTSGGRARLYITSQGVYRAFINGRQVGDHCMAPGWTSYKHHLNYQIFDVTFLLKPAGDNVISVEVGEGWYATLLGFRPGKRCIYGDELGVVAQLEAESSTGEVFRLTSDHAWSCQPSAILRSEIYNGELYDAREETPGWDGSTGVDPSAWGPVRELPFPAAKLIATDAPPVRVTEEVPPVKILTTPSGKTVVDFGQILVGKLRVRKLNKPSGHRVRFTHAEVLENGELGTRPLRTAQCADEIVSAGSELSNWSPQFTFHGFRYVQVDGWTPTDEDPLSLDQVTALVLHTDMARTGWFSCSHPMINQLHNNALWSTRGNFVSIPTDCPQRNERLGWTGDIQIYCPSASFLYHTAGMLSGWLKDLAAEQLLDTNDGIPPFVVPDVLQDVWPHAPQAVWDDVVVLTPWSLYCSYGDANILRRQYPSMIAWLDRGIRRGSDGLWEPQLWQLGDWLDPTAPPSEPGDARTHGVLVADAYLVHVTNVMSHISKILGVTSDARRFRADALRLKAAFQHKYIAPSGLLVGDSQTALSLAIQFDLFSTSEQRVTASERLAQLVRLAKFRVATGFAGTPIITHALTKAGHHQIAYRMLQEKGCPSWMYPITMGATTIWERWDSMLPDNTINPGEMTSFNHYALGSIINWLHTTVAGVSPIEPGWKTFRVAPLPGGTITSAEAQYETPYGRLECHWAITDGDHFHLKLLVPANSKAFVALPDNRKIGVGANDEERGEWVGSGYHQFFSRWDNLTHWPPESVIPIMRKRQPEDIA
ncbi:hypothetical protein PMG11_02912 [Penicillium brasilianum]|uniref:alpha-L-rhamnosidase n=1 Tax=Penicillium brasilianum TaxID=104259 RepID=A0A0F7TIZ9_PENBI|nr:hypothetical protein PMG11_02912 [Penicillium brasilianum]